MTLVALVGLAAAIGAVCRYLFDQLIQSLHDSVFPVGTFTINTTGSFVLGLVTGLAAHHGLDPDVAAVLATGFAGGYTTWSTWAWESLALGRGGALALSSLNVLGSLAAGLLAAGAGLGLALL